MIEDTYPLVRFVSAPALDAEVRFDFNEDFAWPDADSFTLGAPALLGDPGGVAAEYGYRSLSFNLAVRGDESLTLRRQVELARELQRDETYLMFQLSESSPPMWYRCVRSSPGEVSFATFYRDRVTQDWMVSVSLVADPFAMGEKESWSVTIGNDPATGGLVSVLPDILGDAPAPLSVDISAGTTTNIQPWLSVLPLDGAWSGNAIYWQAESLTLGGSTASSSAASASGGSWALVTLGTVDSPRALNARVTGNLTVPYAGRWRVFARVVGSAGAIATFRGAGAACSESKSLAVGPWTGAAMMELGTYTFPKGNMPSAKPYTLGTGEVVVEVGGYAQPPIGSAQAAVDYLVAIPVDLQLDQRDFGRVAEFRNLQQTSGDKVVRLDAEREAVQELTSGAFAVASPEIPAGGFLQVVPGASNVLTVMPRRASDLTTGAYNDQITHTTTLTFSYHPRYMLLAGS